MNTMLLKLYVKFQELKSNEEGQDMVEYALVVALIALAVVTAVTSVGTVLSTKFTNISTTIA